MAEVENSKISKDIEATSVQETVKVPKRKPARLQVDPETIDADEKPTQTGTVFNIWYSKWAGGDSNDAHLQTHSKTRVNIKLDSGYTKADQSRAATTPVFCLYFARGSCCMGKKCDYLHRLPTDEDRVPITQDCFGRDKFSDYRDDMGGVGSFNKSNRTLYIGRINDINDEDIEFKISKNFSEFGEIAKIRVIHSKNIAFVNYKNELNAQFAKEAMAHQSLDKNNVNETLNIRWANEDPDPEAQRRLKRKLEQDTMQSVKTMLAKFDASEEVADVEEEEEVELEEEKEEEEQKVKSILGSNNAGALNVFKQLQNKRQKQQQSVKNTTLQTALTGYESSSDEE